MLLLKNKNTKSIKDKISYALLLGPGLFIYSSIVVFPLLFSIYFSFTQWSGGGQPLFIGLENYKRMFSDPVFLHGVRNNILIILISVFVEVPIGFVLAYILYRKMVKGAKFFQAMVFLPVAISAIIVAILWNQIFAPGGIFTSFVRIITGDMTYVINVFENKTYAIVPILFVTLWMYTGITVVIFLANMQKISDTQLEAALLEGASEWNIMLTIILPQMRKVVITVVIFAIAGSLKSFDLIFAMTGGGPAHYTEVMSIYMYLQTFKYYNYGFGNAVSTVMILFSMILIVGIQFIFKIINKKYE